MVVSISFITLLLFSYIHSETLEKVDGLYKLPNEHPGNFQLGVEELPAGNWSIYRLDWSGPVRLILQSDKGDADLYVSYATRNVFYTLNEHNSSSCTCGVDSVDVPAWGPFAQRPVYVGVYAHPSKQLTQYRLAILMNDNETSFDVNPEDIGKYLSDPPSSEYEDHSTAAMIEFVIEIIVDIALTLIH